MTWRANGNYYSFKEETIKSRAPAVSGVYGLYNFRHQILIGSSANIHSALLRHLRETNFRFRRLEPTGFVFELCAPEVLELRTQELVREYDPVLRTNSAIGLAALWRSRMKQHTLAFYPQVQSATMQAGDETRKVATNMEKKHSALCHLISGPFAKLATGCGAIMLAIGLFMLSPQPKDPSAVARQISLMWKNWTSAPRKGAQVAALTIPGTRNAPESLSQQAEASQSNTEPNTWQPAETAGEPPQPNIFVASEQTQDNHSVDAESKMALLEAKKTPSQERPMAKKAARKNAWAVQAMATTDQRIASDWLEKLKARGYDAFLIAAEIKGQTWYRLRAGNFSTRQEAEALRMALQSKEGFRDAFVAEGANAETLIAKNPR